MSLPVTFHRAASAEFIEASAWYETKRVGLALEFIAEMTVAYLRHLHTLSSLLLFARMFGVLLPIVFHTAFIFAQRNIALLFWQYFMAAEIPLFGWLESNATHSASLPMVAGMRL